MSTPPAAWRPADKRYQRVGGDLHMALSHSRVAIALLGGGAAAAFTGTLLPTLRLLQGSEPWRCVLLGVRRQSCLPNGREDTPCKEGCSEPFAHPRRREQAEHVRYESQGWGRAVQVWCWARGLGAGAGRGGWARVPAPVSRRPGDRAHVPPQRHPPARPLRAHRLAIAAGSGADALFAHPTVAGHNAGVAGRCARLALLRSPVCSAPSTVQRHAPGL